MHVHSELDLDKDDFVRAATDLFPCDRATAETLLPMVTSLRSLARRVSESVRGVSDLANHSRSATGD